MKQWIMRRAHELAKKMEGDYLARMALALRQAWREANAMASVVISVNHQPTGGKEWVAEITGRHPKYKFQRVFLRPVERDWSRSGKTGVTRFELEEGKVYEVNEPWKGRRFVAVRGGEVVTLTADEVLAAIA